MTCTESLFKTIILLQHLSEIHKTDDIDIYYIDLFCGAGGTSTGVELATINGHSAAKVVACVNHDKNAIASHMANHPYALHFTEDMRTLDLSPIVNLVKKIRFRNPNAKIVLWASLECTNFSKAKGGQARDADSRTLAEHLFRYIDEINPDLIQIENVEEFMCWGDLDENGKPVSKDRGRLYLRWVNAVKKCGYKFDHRILNAADFRAYTSRKRFFGQFAKKDMPIVWPEATHCKEGSTTLFGELQKWKPVKDVLDLEDEGTSIFKRKKPLSPKTFERVYAGLIRHVAGGKDKWLLKYNSINGQTGKHVPPSIDEPCPTVSCQGRLGVVQTQFISKYFSGHPDSKNIPTFVKIAPDGNIIIEVYESDIPIVRKIKEFMAMYQIVDILMRMLKIPELKRIMGFPENYKLIGTQAEQKKYIGNAVEVNMARVLCEAIAFKIHQLKQAS